VTGSIVKSLVSTDGDGRIAVGRRLLAAEASGWWTRVEEAPSPPTLRKGEVILASWSAREDDAIEENPRAGDRVWDYMGVMVRV
jgi:hypothetical protein